MHPHTHTARHGFTLVEMSVVMAVIGMLIGGVLVGQNLISKAKINRLISDLNKYKTAYTNFKIQYKALPGDMLDATEYWGTDPDGCPSHTNYVPKKETCSGTGEGYIGYNGTGASGGTTYAYESYRAWQHLADAGYIDGRFSGVANATVSVAPNINVPTGSFPNSGVTIASLGSYSTATGYYPAYYGTYILYGRPYTTNMNALNPILSSRQAYGIDSKIDDGLPAKGALLSLRSNFNSGCTTNNDETVAQYDLTGNTITCSVLYILESY